VHSHLPTDRAPHRLPQDLHRSSTNPENTREKEAKREESQTEAATVLFLGRSTLNCCPGESFGPPGLSVRWHPSRPASLVVCSQSLQWKKTVLRLKGCTTSTCSRCQAANIPLLSCRMIRCVSSPRSLPLMSNASFFALSKLQQRQRPLVGEFAAQRARESHGRTRQ